MKNVLVALAVGVLLLCCQGCNTDGTGVDVTTYNLDYELPDHEIQPYGINFHNGIGNAKNEDGEWIYIRPNGEELDYDMMQSFIHNASIVSNDGKFGMINKDFNEILPLVYDAIRYADYDSIYYVLEDEMWSTLDVTAKTLYQFDGQTGEADVDVSDICAVVVNGNVVGFNLDKLYLPMLQHINFAIYDGVEKAEGRLSFGINELDEMYAYFDGIDSYTVALHQYQRVEHNILRRDEAGEGIALAAAKAEVSDDEITAIKINDKYVYLANRYNSESCVNGVYIADANGEPTEIYHYRHDSQTDEHKFSMHAVAVIENDDGLSLIVELQHYTGSVYTIIGLS